MFAILDSLRGISFEAVVLRLVMAMLIGGFLGLERVRKHRPAGIRTYMLVCTGAAMTMILGQYQAHMLQTAWAEAAALSGIRPDVARFSAQVISGIGFLGAGTVLVTGKQEVKGLTTAAGLWVSACMGIAVGAGFYECVALAFIMVFLCNGVLPYIESFIVENARNMNIYVEFESLDNVSQIITRIKEMNTQIYDVDIERELYGQYPYHRATISLRLGQRRTHAKLILAVSELECVHIINEI